VEADHEVIDHSEFVGAGHDLIRPSHSNAAGRARCGPRARSARPSSLQPALAPTRPTDDRE
jgi:hypothetical protein